MRALLCLLIVAGCADDTPSTPTAPSTASPSDASVADTDPAVDTTTTGPETTVDPCAGVPVSGRCRDGRTLERCVFGSGSSAPHVATVSCPSDTRCEADASGVSCVLTAECVEGTHECHGDALATCDGGVWIESACARGCVPVGADASCKTALPTYRYHNTFTYELRVPSEAFDDWSRETYTAPGRGFLVASYADGELIDQVLTDDEGAFTIDAVRPEAIDGDDYLVVVAARYDTDGQVAFGVFDPDLTAGEHDVGSIEHGVYEWYWPWSVADIPADEGVFLSIDAGSGAAFAFDYLEWVYDFATGFYGTPPKSGLMVWLGFGVSWSCGACFNTVPYFQDGFGADNQIWIPADGDEGYWSGPVLAHELGHWVMSTFGVSPREGGDHIAGVPSHPGLAWSEGFATWLSDLVRGEPFYYDKQGGLMFWVDHAASVYSSGADWIRPRAADGLEQLIDENEVTRMLLALTTDDTVDGMLAALSGPRMTIDPFLRGYHSRSWDGLDASGLPLPYRDTTLSAPHLADFLDALVCEDVVTPSVVDAVTEPGLHYPFPSASPRCRSARLPLTVRVARHGDAVHAEVMWHARLDVEARLRLVGVAADERRVPADGAHRARWLDARAASAVSVEVDGPGWRIRGTLPLEANARAPDVGAPRSIRGGVGP